MVRGAIERFPPSLYLRETALTAADPAIAEFAEATRRKSRPDVLSALHALLERMHRDVSYDQEGPTHSETTAAEAFALKRGVCQDFTQCSSPPRAALTSRPATSPATVPPRRRDVQEAAHAWAEAWVGDLGWVAFDPANGICATTPMCGSPAASTIATPRRCAGTRSGGGSEALDVTVRVSCPLWPSQSQSQSQP